MKFSWPLRPLLVSPVCSAVAAVLLAVALPELHPAVRAVGLAVAVGIPAATGVSVALRRRGAARVGEWSAVLYAALVAAAAVIFRAEEWLSFDGEEDLESLLERNRSAAIWIYAAVCFLQPIALPLPEALTVMAGSAALGAFRAFAAGFAGTMAGVSVMFALARFGGAKLIARLVKPEQLEKYHRYVARNEVLILVALFVIPVLPDEIICVGAGLSGVSFGRFLLIASLAKLTTSFVLAYSLQLGAWLSLSPSQTLLVAGGIALAGVALSRAARLWRRRGAARRAAQAGHPAGRESGEEADGAGDGGDGGRPEIAERPGNASRLDG